MESMNPDPIPQDVSFPPAAPARVEVYSREDSGKAVEDIRDWNYADYRSDSLLFPDK